MAVWGESKPDEVVIVPSPPVPLLDKVHEEVAEVATLLLAGGDESIEYAGVLCSLGTTEEQAVFPLNRQRPSDFSFFDLSVPEEEDLETGPGVPSGSDSSVPSKSSRPSFMPSLLLPEYFSLQDFPPP